MKTRKKINRNFYSIVLVWMGIIIFCLNGNLQGRDVLVNLVKQIGPLAPCPPTVNGLLLYTEVDKAGNKIEIYCNTQYQMKFTRADGTVVWVGKCPFPLGHNTIAKKILVKATMDGNKVKIKKEDIEKPERTIWTYWKSVKPVGPRPAPDAPGTAGPFGVGKDRLWIYDVSTNKYIRQETKHRGRWTVIKVLPDGRKIWVWKVQRQWADGRPTTPQAPPDNPGQLSFEGDLPDENTPDGHFVVVPDPPAAYTPLPFTVYDEEDNPYTYTASCFYSHDDPEFEEIFANANQEFTYDINMPHEEEGLVNYTLIEGPTGMELDPETGAFYWEPTTDQIGFHKVILEISYAEELGIEISEFMLQVKPSVRDIKSQSEKEDESLTYLLYVAALIILVLLLLVLRKRKPKDSA